MMALHFDNPIDTLVYRFRVNNETSVTFEFYMSEDGPVGKEIEIRGDWSQIRHIYDAVYKYYSEVAKILPIKK
jgi:hypothetical protein